MSSYNPNPKLSAMESLEILVEGNERFVRGDTRAPVASDLSGLTQGQSPFSIVLTCADSRVQPNAAFDRPLGDLFVVRVAGNVVSPVLIGSIELAAMNFGTPLCVVLGHTRCGLIETAIAEKPMASHHLDRLVKRVMPAVRTVRRSDPDDGLSPAHLAQKVMLENVKRSSNTLLTRSPILSRLASQGKFAVVQAHFEIETGRVHFDFSALRRNHPDLVSCPRLRELAAQAEKVG